MIVWDNMGLTCKGCISERDFDELSRDDCWQQELNPPNYIFQLELVGRKDSTELWMISKRRNGGATRINNGLSIILKDAICSDR